MYRKILQLHLTKLWKLILLSPLLIALIFFPYTDIKAAPKVWNTVTDATFNVPLNMTTLEVKMWGGGGGGGGGGTVSTGGAGGGAGYITGTIPVTPGETLTIRVGGGGGGGAFSSGAAGNSSGDGGGGGGYSGIFRGGTALLIAPGGGGGGGGDNTASAAAGGAGGVGGGTTGGTGGTSGSTTGGGGGTSSAGGAAGSGAVAGEAGSSLTGGQGAYGTTATTCLTQTFGGGGTAGTNGGAAGGIADASAANGCAGGGGGGGGYYGGGGGGNSTSLNAGGGGGGGGSSRADGTVSSVTSTSGSGSSAGNNGDSYYTGSAGAGGSAGALSGAGSAGNPGLVVITNWNSVDITFLGTADSTANNTVYTAASQNLGTPATDRYIIVAIHSRDAGTAARTIDSVTVAGVQATIVGQVQSIASNNDVVGLAIARVSAGTSGDVVVTFNSSMERAALALYRVTGMSNTVPFEVLTSTASNPSAAIDVPAGGFVIGAANTGANTTATWSNLIEDYDAVVETNLNYTGAMNTYSSAQSNLSVQATFGTNTNPAGIFASWSTFGDSGQSGETTFTSPVVINEDVAVTGALAKGSGTFVIDHPLDPTRKLLYHSFVESPDVKNIYDGVVTLDSRGAATVELPDYFETLNKDHRFLLTPIGQPAPELFVQSSGVVNNKFTIAGGPPNAKVSWQVTGIRQDPYILANPVINEVKKGPDSLVNLGEYLFKGYLNIE